MKIILLLSLCGFQVGIKDLHLFLKIKNFKYNVNYFPLILFIKKIIFHLHLLFNYSLHIREKMLKYDNLFNNNYEMKFHIAVKHIVVK
jgi:hypothetical protein